MARKANVWWWKPKGYWVSELGGRRVYLAKGWKNKKLAEQKFRKLVAERQLLDETDGAITIAALCEMFLADAAENLATSTYQSYQYSCQKLVDQFGDRLAHTLEPMDIKRFTRHIKQAGLNPTSQAIVLRSIQRCFNWGVEEAMIPPHKLGRIRKPTPLQRDRFLEDKEFQSMLRATNPRDQRRTGAPFRRLLLAMDWTLCRPGELTRLQWKHVHWDQNVAILPEHKTRSATKKPKVIVLIPKMKRLLSWLKSHGSSEYCFLNSRGKSWTVNAIDQRMAHVRDRAGFGSDVLPYTLRHRAATNAIIKTGDLKTTSLLLGHTSTQTTERYTHLAQQHLVDFAVRAVG